jgi:hypothetical protein
MDHGKMAFEAYHAALGVEAAWETTNDEHKAAWQAAADAVSGKSHEVDEVEESA